MIEFWGEYDKVCAFLISSDFLFAFREFKIKKIVDEVIHFKFSIGYEKIGFCH